MSLVIEENEIDSLPISVNPKILGGTPVFRGTRVPVDALLTNLEAGLSLDEFLNNFPTVSRKQALQVLEFSRATLHRLDECTPHVLKQLLTGFEITTVQDVGWAGITNGALLQRAEGRFDALITTIRI